MKNRTNTQERSPISDDSTSPIHRPQNKSLLANHPWLLVVGVGVLLMAIAAMAILSLTNTGNVEKDPAKQTTIIDQKAPSRNKSNLSPNWWPTILLLTAGGAGTIAIYKWRRHLPNLAQRGLTRRQQRKLALRQGSRIHKTPTTTPEITPKSNSLNNDLETLLEVLLKEQIVEPVLMDVSPTITVLPPEEAQANDLGGQSLAEMMDIRKHLSLATILHDFKRPD